MTNPLRIIAILLLLCIAPLWCTPAAAISIKEEEDLAREFLKVVAARFDLIEDPMIVDYVNRVGRRILANIPPQPFNFRFYVIKEDVYNAFAIPAGHIFINSGLLAALENEDELAGIMAHEIAHVVNRHISQRIERSKKVDMVTLAGLVAGVFLGVAGGNTDAAQALSIGSLAAGVSTQLAYSREDETQADESGLAYMRQAGYTGEAMLSALKKIRSKQWFGTREIPSYMMTHPALEERIVGLDTKMLIMDRKGKGAAPPLNADKGRFAQVNTRLNALYQNADAAFQQFSAQIKSQPQDPNTLYGYGLVLARRGQRSEAVEYLKQALARKAFDPVFLSDLGRVYFMDGKYDDALNTLEGALSVAPDSGEALFYLARTRMELGRYPAAVEALEKLLEIHPDYRPAYQLLGEANGRSDRLPEAHYYLGLYHYQKGDYPTARHHLARALKELSDPDKLEQARRALADIKKTAKKG